MLGVAEAAPGVSAGMAVVLAPIAALLFPPATVLQQRGAAAPVLRARTASSPEPAG